MEEKNWNTTKPGVWKSEELSQGRVIDYKAFNFVDGEGVRNSLYVSGCMLKYMFYFSGVDVQFIRGNSEVCCYLR